MPSAHQDESKVAISRRGLIAAAGTAMLLGVETASQAAAKIPDLPGLIVLYSGKPEQLAQNWQFPDGSAADWKIDGDAIESQHRDIVTKQKFMDFVLHVEFKVPLMPNAHGQERGNSGVGLQSRYEVQVLDSYGFAEPGTGDCGALYSQAAPLFNACKKPLEWQTYDIVFRAPRFDAAGTKTEMARATVFQNGILVQNNQEIHGPTGINDGRPESEPGSVLLQYHHNTVQYRNIWIVPLPSHGATHYEPR
jgi:hypothetical protein